LRKLLRHRHPDHILPDDDAGREYLFYLLHAQHFTVPVDEREQVLATVADEWAPWLDPIERSKMICRALRLRKHYSAEKLGNLLNLTEEERRKYRLRTIRAAGMTDEKMRQRRVERQRESDEQRRRRAGMEPREQWLAARSISREKPWKALESLGNGPQ
jgi:hypothetical protein